MSPSQTGTQAASRDGIVPGSSIGAIRIGAPFSDGVAAYGQPAVTQSGTDAFAGNVVVVTWPSTEIAASYADTNANAAADAGEACLKVWAVSPATRRLPGAPATRAAAALSSAHSEPQSAVTVIIGALTGTLAPYGGATAQQIRIGSSRQDVDAAYGQPGVVSAIGAEWYDAQGIVFGYDAQGKVATIGVYAP